MVLALAEKKNKNYGINAPGNISANRSHELVDQDPKLPYLFGRTTLRCMFYTVSERSPPDLSPSCLEQYLLINEPCIGPLPSSLLLLYIFAGISQNHLSNKYLLWNPCFGVCLEEFSLGQC